jgi:hypothetical protein
MGIGVMVITGFSKPVCVLLLMQYLSFYDVFLSISYRYKLRINWPQENLHR